MSLLEKIAEDMKVALKGGQQFRLDTLRTLRAALLEKQVEKRPSGGMTADDEMQVLISASKKRKESITVFSENNRPELAAQESRELEIIQEYLPQQLSADDVAKVVRTAIETAGATSAKDFGKVMPLVMKELKGKADGKLIQDTVKQLLGA